jgi:exosortase/archaeosortase
MAWINTILAFLWFAPCALMLYRVLMQQQRLEPLMVFVIVFIVVLSYVPFSTARTLFKGGPMKRAKRSVRYNFSMMVLGVISATVGAMTTVGRVNIIIAPLLLIIPQWFSIKALNRVMLKLEQDELPIIYAPEQVD